jgi:DNA-directed RNA polymerase specialized sigma54-like protein
MKSYMKNLVMTPLLLQAIKFLEMTNEELERYIESELKRNPLLERADDGEAPVPIEKDTESSPVRDRLANDIAPGGSPSVAVGPVVPDVIICPADDGGWVVALTSGVLPKILVKREFANKVSTDVNNDGDASHITESLQTANWLTRCIEQRAKVVLKVASEIARQQDAFLAHGAEHLRPVSPRTIADAIGFHESTIRRVISNRFVATPHGVFEMKCFFELGQ